MMAPEVPDEVFREQRPRLFALAYRMLGSAADAEDVLQDAWLRWQGAQPIRPRETGPDSGRAEHAVGGIIGPQVGSS